MNIFKKIKYLYQRITKGYCDKDLWDLDYFIISKVRKPLKEFIKLDRGGYPVGVKSYKEWNKILKKIDKAFDIVYSGEGMNEKNQDVVLEGMRLFGKYWDSLWW